MSQTVIETDPTTTAADDAADEVLADEVLAELLVEEISIDGMCGVY